MKKNVWMWEEMGSRLTDQGTRGGRGLGGESGSPGNLASSVHDSIQSP